MQVIEAFTQVMHEEILLTDRLIHLGLEKKESIYNVERLSSIIDQEQKLVGQLEFAQRQRQDLLDVIGPGQPLLEWVQDGERPAMKGLGQNLHRNYTRLDEINNTNQMLIKESLAFIQFSISLIMDDNPVTYGKPGSGSLRKSIFDRKV